MLTICSSTFPVSTQGIEMSWTEVLPLKPKTRENYERYSGYVQDWLDANSLDWHDLTPENFTTFLATRTTWGNASKYHCWNACKKRLSVLFGEYHPLKDFRIRREVSPPPNVLTSEQGGDDAEGRKAWRWPSFRNWTSQGNPINALSTDFR